MFQRSFWCFISQRSGRFGRFLWRRLSTVCLTSVNIVVVWILTLRISSQQTRRPRPPPTPEFNCDCCHWLHRLRACVAAAVPFSTSCVSIPIKLTSVVRKSREHYGGLSSRRLLPHNTLLIGPGDTWRSPVAEINTASIHQQVNNLPFNSCTFSTHPASVTRSVKRHLVKGSLVKTLERKSVWCPVADFAQVVGNTATAGRLKSSSIYPQQKVRRSG